MALSPRDRAHQLSVPALFTRNDLLRHGFTAHGLRAGLRSGVLVRLRRDRYARPDTDDAIIAADVLYDFAAVQRRLGEIIAALGPQRTAAARS